MTVLRESLISELNKLQKESLIDLLLLSERDQSDELRNLNKHIDIFKTSGGDKKESIATLQISNCARCQHEKNEKGASGATKTEGTSSQSHYKKSEQNKDEGLDNFVGVYMAYSLFHGYLNLVIPNTGTNEPHLKELMQVYEATEKIEFDFYKLFMLIPKSTYCPRSLQEVSSRIKESRSLNDKRLTVAGVQGRSYKNSVYKIFNKENNAVTYVCVEYATPVKTYKDVLTYNYGEDSEAYKRNKDKVVAKFHETLQKILIEHENCTNFCELIFYDDKNIDGTFKDVADVIMERIQKLKERTVLTSQIGASQQN